jgi:hypothetical protein
MLRRRSFMLGTGFYYAMNSNLSTGIHLASVFGQRIYFTNAAYSTIYQQNTVANSFQYGIRIIWKPWQNRLRNKQKAVSDIPYTDQDSTDDLDLLGF